MMHANHREEIEECFAGDICAGVGLKQTGTGDTLCAPDAPIVLETIEFPEPVIAVAIEPKTKADQEKLSASLARLAEEDPTFQVQSDEETGQTLIHGMGELHLEVIVDRLLREFSVDANVGRPQVAYRETIRARSRRSWAASCARPAAAASTATWSSTSSRRPARASTSSTRSRAARSRASSSPPSSRASRRRSGSGDPRRLSDGGRAGGAGRRLLPRRRLLGDGLQDRRLDGRPGGRPPREPGAARAGDGGRGRHARGVPGRRDRRPLASARQGPGPGAARKRRRDPGFRARSGRCSATRPTCAPPRRDARPTRCSSSATRRCRRASPSRLVEHRSPEPVAAA